MTDLHPYTLPAAAELLGLLLAPAVDRWAERFDAWVEGRRRRYAAVRGSPRQEQR